MAFRKKFPVFVCLFKKYGNVVKPSLDKGRYRKQRLKTEDGFIENNYFYLKKEKLKIPAPDLKFYHDIEVEEGKSERWIYLMQIDRYTYYPISYEGDAVYLNIPYYILATDIEGKPIVDENGKQKIMVGEDGKPLIQYKKQKILDSTVLLNNGKTIKIPALIAHKTYDKEHWLSNEIETDQRLYRSKGFWDRYGNIVIMALTIFAVIGIIAVSLPEYTKNADKFVQGSGIMADALKNVTSTCTAFRSAIPTIPIHP
jgi:hypothetical protein